MESALKHNNFTDSAGYEIPNPKNPHESYMDLNYRSPHLYDGLHTKEQSTERNNTGRSKRSILVLAAVLLTIIVIALSGIVMFLVLTRTPSCEPYDREAGFCSINSNGDSQCICPENKVGINCENVLREPFRVSLCPVDWNDEGQLGCYKIYNQPMDKRTWIEAREFCRSVGSDLASIPSLGVQELIRKAQNDSKKLWVGLSRIAGSFRWSDGSKLTYANWRPGEPNNFFGNEQCVNIWEEGKWNDNSCHMSFGFICSIAKTNVCGKSGEWMLYNSNCYMFSQRSLTRGEAVQACGRLGASLVHVNSTGEHNFLVRQLTKYYPNNFWIGSHNVQFAESGRPTTGCTIYYSEWGVLGDTYCLEKNRFICAGAPEKK